MSYFLKGMLLNIINDSIFFPINFDMNAVDMNAVDMNEV